MHSYIHTLQVYFLAGAGLFKVVLKNPVHVLHMFLPSIKMTVQCVHPQPTWSYYSTGRQSGVKILL